ncbi:MAG: extracellular matrix regulator RemB [Bacillota bacterium]
MYIHLGWDQLVKVNELVALVDIEEGLDQDNQQLVAAARARGAVTQVSALAPKTIVVTTKQLYLTPVSVRTIQKRFGDPLGTRMEDE